jgi:hypothetical protein
MLFNNFNIDANTIISKGMSLSQHFILAHASNGAYHYIMGKIVPTFTSFLIPGSSSIPDWKVAANLQMGAQGILEGLLSQFGSDLIVRSGFLGSLGNITPSSIGQSFGIQVKGFENNMFGVAKQIQQLTNKASNLSLVYGNTSYMQVDFNEKSILNNVLTNVVPKLSTVDTLNNAIEQGITSIRGLI